MIVISKLPIFGRKLNKIFIFALLAVVTGCSQTDTEKRLSDGSLFLETDIDSLPGWNNDKVLNAFPALQKSCRSILKKLDRRHSSKKKLKKHSSWQNVCDQITKNSFGEDSFHVLWYLLLDEFKPKEILEIGVYRGQVLTLWSLISKELEIKTNI